MAKNRKGIIRSTPQGFHVALSDKEFNKTPSRAKGAAAAIIGPYTEFTEPVGKHETFPEKDKGQGVLWNVDHTPPSIDELGVTKGNKHLLGPLLGTVAAESQARYGEMPTNVEGTWLFKDSEKLVKKFQDKGIAKGTPRYADMAGGHDLAQRFVRSALLKRRNFLETPGRITHREIGEPEISHGSEITKSLFRDRREKPKTDPNQTKFEGM